MSNQPKDTAIIMVGLTGSEKSAFISALEGNPIGDGLDSYAKTAEAFTVPHPHDSTRHLILVSFNDTYGDDKRVMKDIFDWLASRQNEGLTIAGIIFFHEITLTRMGWAAQSGFKKLLCSDTLSKNILLVTTKWGEVEPAIGKKREDDLRDTYWKETVQSDAMARFEPTPTSTSTILDILLHKPPIFVHALVDQRKFLKQLLQRPAKSLNDVMDWLRKAFMGSSQRS